MRNYRLAWKRCGMRCEFMRLELRRSAEPVTPLTHLHCGLALQLEGCATEMKGPRRRRRRRGYPLAGAWQNSVRALRFLRAAWPNGKDDSAMARGCDPGRVA